MPCNWIKTSSIGRPKGNECNPLRKKYRRRTCKTKTTKTSLPKNVLKLTTEDIKKEILKEKFEKLDKEGKLDSFLQKKRRLQSFKVEKDMQRMEYIKNKKVRLNWFLFVYKIAFQRLNGPSKSKVFDSCCCESWIKGFCETCCLLDICELSEGFSLMYFLMMLRLVRVKTWFWEGILEVISVMLWLCWCFLS